MPDSPRILFVATSAESCGFFTGILGRLRQQGFEVILACSPGEQLQRVARQEGVVPAEISMQREIAPLSDIRSLWKLYLLIRTLRPILLNVNTPKAGLIGGIAGWLAGAQNRIYTLHGLRLETAKGPKRWILWISERIACSCADRVLAVSPSLRARAIALKVVRATKIRALKRGGVGIDLSRFSPGTRTSRQTYELRKKLGFVSEGFVIGFVGRIVRDKGIQELVEAFKDLRKIHSNLRLLLLGDFESGDPVAPEISRYIESTMTIVRLGFVDDTAPYYGLMDVLVLPSYREGFPGVTLEAQASGVPVVTTTATGAVDSIIDGVTGILVPVGDTSALTEAIHKLLADFRLRTQMGQAGRRRMEQDFRPEAIWSALIAEYRSLLRQTKATSELVSPDGEARLPT
jgi:glycosyltransferase involved in cell wall biosynthesis